MTFDYTRAAATADRLIARFGQSCTLRRTTNAADPWSPTRVTTDSAITAVDLSREVRNADGALTGETRRTLYIRTSEGVVPAKTDRIFIGLTPAQVAALTDAQQAQQGHEIVALRPLAPGGTDVFYEADLAT